MAEQVCIRGAWSGVAFIGCCRRYFTNLSGDPSASIPAGMIHDRLPVGMQIVRRNVRPLTEIYAELHSGLRREWTIALLGLCRSRRVRLTSMADAISSGYSRDTGRATVGGGGLRGRELVVVVADANSAFRSGVVGVLARETDIRAVPAAAAEALIGLVDRLQPAVVLADVDLPPGGRLAAIERIKRRAPMTQTVAIVTAPDREVVLAVMRAGARGIIERTVHSTSLVRVVRHAAAGEITLPRRHSGYVLDELARAERGVDARAALIPLSSREREILALIVKGLRNREIAVILSISELTVKRHVHNMLEKLGVPTR
jgi:DNA-binding NarL/FixJ family response regulator